MTAESRFPTLAELVHHHSIHSDGLITQVTFCDVLTDLSVTCRYFSYYIPPRRGTSPLCLHWVLKLTNGKWTGKKSDMDPLSHFAPAFKVQPFTLQFCPRTRDWENEMGSWLALKVPFSPLFTHLYYVCTAVKCSLCPAHSPSRRGERCTGRWLSGIIYCYWLGLDDLYFTGRTSWWSTSWAGASMETCTRPSGRGTTSP